MKFLPTLSFAAALFAASFSAAHASTLSGTLSFTGKDTANGTTSINFGAASVNSAGTGSFSGFNSTSSVNFLDFAFDTSNPKEKLFSLLNASGTENLIFRVTDYTYNAATKTYVLAGILNDWSVSGSDRTLIGSTNATMTMTNTTQSTFVANIAPTPEPNSLILLGTGLTSAFGVVYRRRRQAV